MKPTTLLTLLLAAPFPALAQESNADLVRKLRGSTAQPTTPAPSTTGKTRGFTVRGANLAAPVAAQAPVKTRSFTIRGIPKNIEAASQSGALDLVPLPAASTPSQPAYQVSYQVDPSSQVTRQTILFRVNSTEFADGNSTLEIARLAQAFKDPQLAGLMFVIEGHSSAEGSDTHNLDLSNRRAVAIVQELSHYGVSPQQLVPVGFGESEARQPASAPEPLRAQDRRVEIYRLEQ